MKTIVKILSLSAITSQAATVFRPADNALASVSWDTFTFESPTAGDSGSHGPSQVGTGTLITSSDLSSETIASYDKPPGGFNFNPDTYYFHNGGGAWTATADLVSNATHVRVSYGLLGFGGSAPEAYAVAPGIAGATLINSGSYETVTSQVFFSDFELAAASTKIVTTFGDSALGQSFRSIDAVQLEVFDTLPIPEPSSAVLAGLAGFVLLSGRRK